MGFISICFSDSFIAAISATISFVVSSITSFTSAAFFSVISYFISDKNEEERLNKAADKLVTSEEMRQIVRQQIHEMVGNFLENITDEIVDKTERQLEMLSNEVLPVELP